MTMTNNEAELREQIAKVMVDYGVDFYEGNLRHREEQRLGYIKAFQDDLMFLISDHTRKERSRTLNDITIWANQEMAKDHVALKQPTVEEE